MYEYTVNKNECPQQMLHYSLYVEFSQVAFSLSQFLEH